MTDDQWILLTNRLCDQVEELMVQESRYWSADDAVALSETMIVVAAVLAKQACDCVGASQSESTTFGWSLLQHWLAVARKSGASPLCISSAVQSMLDSS